MTAQIADTLMLGGEKYEVVGIDGTDPFSPEDYGLSPVMWHTACYRGYVLGMAVQGDSLALVDLSVCDADCRYPEINGVKPVVSNPPVSEVGIAEYSDLGLPLSFTGRLRLGGQFDQERYVHQGFQSPSAYHVVIDLEVVDGQVVQMMDRSDDLGATSKPPEERPREDLGEWIERRYERRMEEPDATDSGR